MGREFRVYDGEGTLQHWLRADVLKYDADCENLGAWIGEEQTAELHVEPNAMIECNMWRDWKESVPITRLEAY